MSLTARLFLEGHKDADKGIKILSCEYSFSQDVDPLTNYVKSRVRAGLINLVLYSTDDAEIAQWMLHFTHKKNGKITFSGPGESGAPEKKKSLEFEDGILVNYHETFNEDTEMITNLSITARKITLSPDAQYEATWEFSEGD
ncbi:MAG: type VI secretion system tube protein TssD [Tangfeifania sp.]